MCTPQLPTKLPLMFHPTPSGVERLHPGGKKTAVGRHRVFLKTPDENLACIYMYIYIYMAAGVYFLLVYMVQFCKTYVCDCLWHVVKEMLGNMMSTSTCIGCKLQHIILTVTNPFEMNDT